jgi:hypothetical protein
VLRRSVSELCIVLGKAQLGRDINALVGME